MSPAAWPKPRRTVAVITVEIDDKGDYHASAAMPHKPAPLDSRQWRTLLGCLDGIGRQLLAHRMADELARNAPGEATKDPSP